jgi:hypothetical protein
MQFCRIANFNRRLVGKATVGTQTTAETLWSATGERQSETTGWIAEMSRTATAAEMPVNRAAPGTPATIATPQR